MKVIGRITEMDEPSGIGVVSVEHAGNVETTIFRDDCIRAGIAPVVGTRLAYVIGGHARGSTAAIDLERLG
jgi:hypothetical protein